MVAHEPGERYRTPVQLLPASTKTAGTAVFFSYYELDTRDEFSEEEGEERGEFRGGETFWGTLGLIQKTFGLSHRGVMWKESWINLQMKMKDMPYYHYKSSEKNAEEKVREGTEDDLKNKFSKYIAK